MDQFVKPLTWIFGAVLTLVGVAGFVMASPLLGLFEVGTVHNVIHILSGVVALGAAATSYQYARLYLVGFGLVYGVVTVLGFLNGTSVLGVFGVNQADNFLHLAIAALCLGVGFGSRKV
ncbi:MAG: hypothetical protein Greene041619_222 [Candidatus Peregrinibacteria bacterium Greene0416_19]|nr:MAG: hypothetical protein Greene041619_222 [Candidatus Peregrinibacteria bacterium Greene0416_19]